MDNEVYYVVGSKYKVIKAVSNGTKEFALNTAKYYRSIGYNARIMSPEEFETINR